MKVSSYSDTKPVPELPGVVKREVINADDGAPRFCMRVFEVEPGSSTPSHSNWWDTRYLFFPVGWWWSVSREKLK